MCLSVCLYMCVQVCVYICEYHHYTPFPGGMVVKEIIRPATSTYQQIKPLRKRQKQSSKNTAQAFKLNSRVQGAKKKKRKQRESSVDDTEQHADKIAGGEEDAKNIASLLVSPRQNETYGDSLMKVCAQNRHTLLNFGRPLA